MSVTIRIVKPLLSAMMQISALLIGLIWILQSGAQAMHYQWQWLRVPDYVFFLKMDIGIAVSLLMVY